jgi:hypothetical protein
MSWTRLGLPRAHPSEKTSVARLVVTTLVTTAVGTTICDGSNCTRPNPPKFVPNHDIGQNHRPRPQTLVPLVARDLRRVYPPRPSPLKANSAVFPRSTGSWGHFFPRSAFSSARLISQPLPPGHRIEPSRSRGASARAQIPRVPLSRCRTARLGWFIHAARVPGRRRPVSGARDATDPDAPPPPAPCSP